MVMRVLGRLLAAGAVALGLLTGPTAAAADAAPVSAAPVAASSYATVGVAMAPAAMCNSPQVPDADKRAMGCFDDRIRANDDYLPAQRWAQAASGLHLRTGDGVIADLSTRLQRESTFPLWMAAANTMWMWSTNITSWAISLDLMKSVGLQVDQIAARLSTAIFSSAVLGAIVGVGIIVVIWRTARGRSNPWKYIMRVGIVLGLMTAMTLGAQQSTVAGGQYRPGPMSPGWIATKTNSIISSLASAPALAISNKMTEYTPDATTTGAAGILSCDAYVAELAAQYADSAGGSGALANKLEASVPMLLSRMWEQTGLEVWKTAQFGSNNSYGDYMYCRLLDERAGQGEVVQMMLTSMAATRAGTPIPGNASPNLYAAPWGTGGDVASRDRSMIAWSACRLQPNGTWAIAGDWGSVTRSGGRAAPTPDDCSKWWNEDYYTDNGPTGWISGDSHNLEFSGSSADSRNDTRQAPEARDFLLSLHGGGANAGGNTVMVIAYAFSSLLVLLVFMFLGGAVLVAKVAAVIIALSIFLMLLKDLLPGQEGNSTAVKLAKTFVGIGFATFALVLLLALVAVVTGFLVDAAASWFGGSSIMTITWTGAAPIIALLSIHLLFTKVLKVPSPLTISGARAWGERINSGAVGNAFASTVASRTSRVGHAATSAAGRGARAAGNEVLRRTTNGRLGGSAPVRRAGAGVGTAATSAAAGAAAGAAIANERAGKMVPGDRTRTRAGAGTGTAPAAAGAATAGTVNGPAAAAGPVATEAPRAAAGAPTRRGVEPASKGSATDAGPQIEDNADRAAVRAARKAERKAALDAELEADRERRGYGTTPVTRRAGDAREAFAERLGDVRRQFAEKPLRSTLRTAGAVGGVAAATVLTGGAALPVIAGVSALSQTHKAREARRRAIESHEERKRTELAAAQEAERKKRERAEKAAGVQQDDVLRAKTPTAVTRRAGTPIRGASRAPAPGVRTPRPVAKRPAIAGGRTAAPRPSAPSSSARRPSASLPPGGEK